MGEGREEEGREWKPPPLSHNPGYATESRHD